MMPGNYPLYLYHGDSYEWQFKLWLDAGKTQPLDLSAATAKSEIRDKSGGAEIWGLDCSILAPNIVTVALTAQMCLTIPVNRKYVWDLQLTYSSNNAVNTIIGGEVQMAPDVTDSTYIAPLPGPPDSEAVKTVVVRAPRLVRR
jgi:hypothetical protein